MNIEQFNELTRLVRVHVNTTEECIRKISAVPLVRMLVHRELANAVIRLKKLQSYEQGKNSAYYKGIRDSINQIVDLERLWE